MIDWTNERDRIKARLKGGESELAPEVQTLLRRDLPPSSLIGNWARLIAEVSPTSSIPAVNVVVLGDATVQPFVEAATVALLREGVTANIKTGQYGAFRQDILDPGSRVWNGADYLLLATSIGAIQIWPSPGMTEAEVDACIDAEVQSWLTLWAALQGRVSHGVIQHTFVEPSQNTVGVAERLVPWSARSYVRRLNEALITASAGRVHWLDTDLLAEAVGRQSWIDQRLLYHGKFTINPRHTRDYALAFGGAWRRAAARAKKVLVVDLDNTLWGGVIGDDGLEGIVLGAGSPAGEAYEHFCRYLLDLAARGVVLAVCSKNDHAIAREVFERHPAMPLTMDSFASFVCNWNDKAGNLKKIAAELNLDLSSFVFADDNPAECELIRRELPNVTVVSLADDPSRFVAELDSLHLFDTSALTPEDLARGTAYAGRRQALELQASTTDLNSYLTGLEMVGRIDYATESELERLAQMELKTNQFNLTTRRLRKDQITDLLRRQDVRVFSIRLADKFTDHGLVSSLVAVLEKDHLRIDSWLMSCRVFSRGLEQFIVNHLVDEARVSGLSTIVGEYLPTPKNGVVADLFPRLGFSPIVQGDPVWWQLRVDGLQPLPVSIVAASSTE